MRDSEQHSCLAIGGSPLANSRGEKKEEARVGSKTRQPLTLSQRRRATKYIAEEVEAMKHGSRHVKTVQQAIAIGLNKARRKG